MNKAKNKMYFYNEFAGQFDSKMNMYETNRRLEVIFDNLIKPEELRDTNLLDAGCGTGWFSKKASELGANVTSMDLGENLLNLVKEKCDSERIVGSVLEIPFEDNSFDVVINTEVIEHTPDPEKAVAELSRVLKPGGLLILTVPNITWKWSVLLANVLKLRPYEGFENWVGYNTLRKWASVNNLAIEDYFGFNFIPVFNRITMPMNKLIDKLGRFFGIFMINIALRARKKK